MRLSADIKFCRLVHDHVPEQNSTAPLRDIAWKVTPAYPIGLPFAFKATEIIGMVLFSLALGQLINNKYRSILLRRFFFHIGTVYMYRIITISFTILPVPAVKPDHCAPKTDGSISEILMRAGKLFLGAGMDITGQNMCGDYIYSGHTSMLTSTTLYILEYSNQDFVLYRIFCQLLAASGIICIVLSHEHYTIDILIAYFVTTHHFWVYHTMASDSRYKKCSPKPWKPGPHLSRVWWWRIFRFMEENVPLELPINFENLFLIAKKSLQEKCKRKHGNERTDV